MNSFCNWCVSITVSVMYLGFGSNSLPVFQIRGRIRDDVFPANEAVCNLHSLRSGSAKFYGPADGLSIHDHEYAIISHRGSRDRNDGLSFLAAPGLFSGEKRDAGVHLGPKIVV